MEDDGSDRGHPGIGRLHYFLAQVGMIASVVFVVVMFGPESRVMSVWALVLMAASVVLDVFRLRNIGVSQWFVFLRFIPFGKTLLWIGLLCAQAGWAETRRLDSSGKSILAAELVLVALIVLMFLRTGVKVFGIPEMF